MNARNLSALCLLTAAAFAPALATPTQGFTVSQGDSEHHADTARVRFGVDGSGVKVGVLANSFNCNVNGGLLTGETSDASGSIASGDLPANVQVLADKDPYKDQCSEGPFFLQDEGRAMLEIIHDLAPGADLMFHTIGNTAVDYAAGIRALADAGATVIVDSGPIIIESDVFFPPEICRGDLALQRRKDAQDRRGHELLRFQKKGAIYLSHSQ